MNGRFSTFVDVLRHRAATAPHDVAYTFLVDGDAKEQRLSPAELDRQARAIAVLLQSAGAAGQRALLLYPPGLEYLAGFFGALYAGVVAVPVYPPDPGRLQRTLPRLQAIAADAQATVVLTTTAILSMSSLLFPQAPELASLQWIATDNLPHEVEAGWQAPRIAPDTLAFLQYTSGSTGTPKGVMISHGNLLHNQHMITRCFRLSKEGPAVTWLPLYHDMGLIGGVLNPLYVGYHCIFMSPLSFLKRPIRWLSAISRYQATGSGAPNFAYDLCARKVREEDRERLDLSRWRLAFTGAEPVRPETLERFTAAFAACGFSKRAFFPVYGLAESTLLVSAGQLGDLPVVMSVDRAALEARRIERVAGDRDDARQFVACGTELPGDKLAIVDPETLQPCAPGHVGEIWVSSDSVGQGYWRRPEESEAVFRAPLGDRTYLRTGDLGFLDAGQLFIAGRIKDMIIIRGRNHFPQEIEASLERCHPVVRPGGTAAFSVDAGDGEQLVVVVELGRASAADPDEVARAIQRVLADEHDLQAHSVALVRAGGIPKTSSGKVQRHACRGAFVNGSLDVLAEWHGRVAPAAAERPEPAPVTPPAATTAATTAAIEAWLTGKVADLLKVAPTQIDIRLPFAHFGVDSAEAVGLAGELEAWLGRPMSPTLAWDHPTIEALARFLGGETTERPRGAVAEERRNEPIAVVGLGCRFPGAKNPAAFWDLLAGGVDAIREIPESRWNANAFFARDIATPGKMNTRWGGFLDDVDQFDPDFFGLTPREAKHMDPQHRILLEVTWEALEDAGLPAHSLAGSATGVFVGICTNDYRHAFRGPRSIDAYTGTGNAFSIAANRISYLLDLQGPSVALDTACSSSLSAVYLACQSLLNGDCGIAIAAGVNLILSPESNVSISKLGVFAPDGRCKVFDARADGIARSEGCGVVILKPLSRALADGDTIYAVVRGGAMNNDGRTNGLTAPSRQAQESVLRTAYARAGVSPAEVDYVELHGTGTVLGDPIEASALGAVLGEGRPAEQMFTVGSVKTNFGHLEAAAGIAGFIKVVLSIAKKALPANLHFEAPNPNIDFERLPLRVQQRLTAWPARERRPLAGVSAFGFGGTNVHMVLEAPPEPDLIERPRSTSLILPLSARNAAALSAQAETIERTLRTGDLSAPELWDLCYTASTRRTHHDERLAVVGATADELGEGLRAFLSGETRPGVATGRRPLGRVGTLAFVFSGQCPLHWSMGRQLLDQETVFRAAIERCDAAISRQAGWSLLEVLRADPAMSRTSDTAVAQPAIFALQVALAELWLSWGVRPHAVVGHSMGEVAAAHVAGVLTLEDAVRVICERSLLLRSVGGRGGGMAAVELSPAEAEALIAPHAGRVSVAVVNGPNAVTLSGDAKVLEGIVLALEARGAFARMVGIENAGHSREMDPIRANLEQALAGLHPRPATLPFCSTVTGARFEGALDAAYWGRNLRDPVLFGPAVQQMATSGVETFVELSPHPILGFSLMQNLRHLGRAGVVLPSLRKEEAERPVMLSSLAALYTQGQPVDWSTLYPLGRLAPLGSYAWQRERCWIESDASGADAWSTAGSPSAHPLLGRHSYSAVPPRRHCFDTVISTSGLPYLADHRVQGAALLPATAFVEMARAGGETVFGADRRLVLENVSLAKALFVSERDTPVQLVITMDGSDRGSFQVLSRSADDGDAWTIHATGDVCAVAAAEDGAAIDPAVWSRCTEPVSGEAHYASLAKRGIEYGPAFQGVARLARRDGEAVAELAVREGLSLEQDGGVHPALVDAALQALAAALPQRVVSGHQDAFLPVRIRRVEYFGARGAADGPGDNGQGGARPATNGTHADAVSALVSHALVRATDRPGVLSGDVVFAQGHGRPLVAFAGLELERLGRDASTLRDEDWLYLPRWQRKPRPQLAEARAAGVDGAPWLVFSDGVVAPTLVRLLETRGERVVVIDLPRMAARGGDHGTIDPAAPAQLEALFGRDFGQAAPRGVVDFWPLIPTTDNPEGLAEAQRLGAKFLLDLVKATLAGGWSALPRLWVVTGGSHSVGGEPSTPTQAPVWGLARVAATEHSELTIIRVDLPTDGSCAEQLLEELVDTDGEDQIALRADGRYVLRLVRDTKGAAVKGRLTAPAASSFRLDIGKLGNLDELRLAEAARRPPAVGEVEIEVVAAGVNFRDVMGAMGMLPQAVPFGLECAGRVVAVGDGVTSVRVGDEVIALAPNSMARYTTTGAAVVLPKPAALTFEEAATIPVPFLTAYRSLCTLAQLSRGERVLIHAAAGGVGLAAVQIAQHLGAEIYATAGSPEKREFLRSLGITHVMDSRTFDFVREIAESTGGRGVDVVLNSLAGEAIAKSLSTLGAYGRFVEIGKADIHQNSHLGLRPFQNNLAYFAVDMDRLARERPEPLRAMWQEIMALFAEGKLRPLEHRTFSLADAVEAFRYMAQRRNTGRVVLRIDDPALLAAADEKSPCWRADATYLITGGLGGLGLWFAEWMVGQGARHLVLTGRRAPDADARLKIEALRARGATVVVAQADVASFTDMQALLADIRATLPPLRGVLHGAAVFDDSLLVDLSIEQLDRVLAPKVFGAYHLHALTLGTELDFFALFSSAAAALGSPGQANYAAANAYLDALAHHRRGAGLPACSIDWGPWAEIGKAVELDKGGRLALRGIESIPPDFGTALFGRILASEHAQVVVMSVNWAQLLEPFPAGRRPPLFRELERGVRRGASGGLRARLLDTEPSRRRSLLEAQLQSQLARLLGRSLERIAVDRPVNGFGLDSLVAMEWKNQVQGELGAAPPVTMLLKGATIREIATYLEQQLALPESAPVAVVPNPDARFEPFPLTGIQQSYWVGRGSDFELGDVSTYVYIEYERAGLDLARLERAWQRMIDRHDMLRAIFLPDGRQQVLKEVPPYRIELLDVRGRTEPEVEASLQAVRGHMSHQVLKSDQWPLFDIRAHVLDGGRTRVHVGIDMLIGDVASLLLLSREWGVFYDHPEDGPPELELTFRDYVLAELASRETEAYQRSKQYWHERVATIAPAPELPLACDPASLPSHRFVRRRGGLDKNVWAVLKAKAVREGLTPSMLLCAAYAEALATFSKSPRFTLNLTLFNRLPLHSQVNEIIGDFTTLNLLEAEGSGATFLDRAKRLQAQFWTDLDHREVGGVEVLRELAHRRGGYTMARMPIVFTSVLADFAQIDWLGEQVYSISQTPQVWIDHQVMERSGALLFQWDAVDELFPDGLLQQMFDAYLKLLDALATTESAWTGSAAVSLPESQQQALAAYNQTTGALPEGLLHTLFSARARTQPEQPAVIAGERRLTYEQLDRAANRAGRLLRDLGAKPNRLVAIVMDKGWEQVVAALGILNAGAAYLPIDAALPAERIRYLLDNGQVELVLTQSWLADRLEWPANVRVIPVDTGLDAVDDAPLAPVQSPEDLAYVIFTSGSTGMPKGVMIDHRGAVNTIVDMNERFGVRPSDRVLALSSLNFDLSVYDVFGLLAAGGAIVIPESEATRDPARWAELIVREGVTIWNSVPALMEMLVTYLQDRPGALLDRLRLVLLSGDWIPLTLAAEIPRTLGTLDLVSLGGATEASIWSVVYPIGAVDPAWTSIPYGMAMKNQQLHVLDERQGPRPFWVPGQLYIGGAGLAKGYWRDPEKTNERFIIHPKTQERLYKTGDLGRMTPDGYIEFLGREDFQVKIQGHRIELGEIEAAFAQHPSVRAVVISAIGERNERRLLAHVVAALDRATNALELREFAATKLPAYMVPTQIIFLEALPLTPNGKVDRAALPKPADDEPARVNTYLAPSTPLEVKLVAVVAEVLDVPVERIGMNDNFFELGGDSLLAVQAVGKANRVGIQVNIRQLFRCRTIADVVAIAETNAAAAPAGKVKAKPSAALIAIQPGGARRPLFVAHPSTGNIDCYFELAEALGDDQPLYGLQSPGLEDDDAHLTTIEKMAERYIDGLKMVQPEGPYLLAGWSTGGLIVFEMARQLRAAGVEVGLVGVLDVGTDEKFDDIEFLPVWVNGALSGTLSVDWDRIRHLSRQQQLGEIAEAARAAHLVPQSFDIEKVLRVADLNHQAMVRYTPAPYGGRVTVFRAEQRWPNEVQTIPDLGWGAVAQGGVDIRVVPGTHFTILRQPNVAQLANALEAALSAIRERRGPGRPPKPVRTSASDTAD